MGKFEVAPFIDELMMDTAASLSKAFRYHYPAREGRAWNAVAEANIVAHMGIAASHREGHVFPELPYHGDGNGNKRLDLMLFFPRLSLKLLTEGKRLYSLEKAQEILQDTEKLEKFLTNGEDAEVFKSAQHQIGLVAAITHYSGYAQRWCDPLNVSESKSYKNIGDLSGYLSRDDVYKNRIAVETWYTANGDEEPCWLLYAWSYL